MSRRCQRWAIAYSVVSACLVVVVVAACSCSGGEPDATPMCPSLVTLDACPSGAADAGGDALPPPSWKKDVEPLIERYCIGCHSPGGVGERNEDFSTYGGVKNAGTTFGALVSTCAMPPADAGGQPTPAERLTLITWDLACRRPNN